MTKPLADDETAVDVQRLAGNVAGVVGSEEDDRPAGARSRSYASHAGQQMWTSAPRNLFKGAPSVSDPAGSKELISLARGIYENRQPTYHIEEQQIHQVSQDIRDLITNLEKREKDNETEAQ